MPTILEIASAKCGFWRKIYGENWHLEMMKTLDRPETFSKQNFKKRKYDAWPALQQFHKSLIIVNYHVAS